MTERRKSLLTLAILLGVLILFFSQILFTAKLIRAPDIINEFYWGIKDSYKNGILDAFRFDLKADWSIFSNSGDTTEGGWVAAHFLFWHALLFNLIPAPASVAWFIVLYLFFGATGTFLYCRLIGVSRSGALLAGLIFALAPENASLINAGHVLKIASICYAPWGFYFLEKGLTTRRLIFFLTAGLFLALQFFAGHWQISYYTCLAIGVYGLVRSLLALRAKRDKGRQLARLLGLNLALLAFFLTTVAMALLPLASWSVQSNRGSQSGANAGRGGLEREEAMSWSLPPEELGTFIIPGFFGLSRQEGGENPANIASYYWGRMNFTQTTDYMGLLPWLLVPLPLLFRRDRYTWLAVAGVVGGIMFSMGKYNVIYQLLFDYFPGINRFRVPKMIMFLPVMALGVLAARGLDCLLDEELRKTRSFAWYLRGLCALPVALLVLLGLEIAGKSFWVGKFYDLLSQPNRYEQGGALVAQRWNNLVTETGIAVLVASGYAAVLLAFSRKWLAAKLFPLVLLALFAADVGRVNAKFIFTVDVPAKSRSVKTPVIDYLSRAGKEYRVLPLHADPMQYVVNNIPIMFTSHPVQQRRWQEVLDTFALSSVVPDMLNVKYLVYDGVQYEQEKGQLPAKFRPVFRAPDGGEVVLENQDVLPKGWLVPSVAVIADQRQLLETLHNPAFDPRKVGLVETPPPFPMADPAAAGAGSTGTVRVTQYEGEQVTVVVEALRNALLVLGEKYNQGWQATVDGKEVAIYPVNHILRGVYLPPGNHTVAFAFEPISFRIGKYLTLASFALFGLMLVREAWLARRKVGA